MCNTQTGDASRPTETLAVGIKEEIWKAGEDKNMKQRDTESINARPLSAAPSFMCFLFLNNPFKYHTIYPFTFIPPPPQPTLFSLLFLAYLGIIGGLANKLTEDLITQLHALKAVGHNALDRKNLLVCLQFALIEEA